MIRDRILQIIKEEGVSSSEFAERIGIQRSSVSHVLSGRNKPSYDFIEKLLRAFPDINANWLISGKGEIYKAPGSHQNLFESQPSSDQQPATSDQQPATSDQQPEARHQPPASPAEASAKEGDRQPPPGIKKIMILRDDGTYEEFHPQKSDKD